MCQKFYEKNLYKYRVVFYHFKTSNFSYLKAILLDYNTGTIVLLIVGECFMGLDKYMFFLYRLSIIFSNKTSCMG